jgi:hypothetical protein
MPVETRKMYLAKLAFIRQKLHIGYSDVFHGWTGFAEYFATTEARWIPADYVDDLLAFCKGDFG